MSTVVIEQIIPFRHFIDDYENNLVTLPIDDDDIPDYVDKHLFLFMNRVNYYLKEGLICDTSFEKENELYHEYYVKLVSNHILSKVLPRWAESNIATARVLSIGIGCSFTIEIKEVYMDYSSVYNKLRQGTTVSFEVYPSALYGDMFQRVTVMDASVSARTAGIATKLDAEAEHAKVAGSLPPGSPMRYDDYSYVIVETLQGQLVAVGIPWIVASSIVVHSAQDTRITVKNSTSQDNERIRQALVGIGITDFSMEVVDHSK